ncbi:transposase [Ignavibacterium sp.]|uniref:transposase n=1 Tax=Ignavibacterium sp. TaxID=2651167 RepID=UPI00307ED634
MLRQIKAFLEQKNHPLKWQKWNKGLLEQLKELKFQDKLFDQKFRSLLTEYEYVISQIKDTEKIIEQIKEDQELGRRIQIIEGINGIGIISAVRMSIYLFDKKDRFESSERLNHYLGLTPSERSSGDAVARETNDKNICSNKERRRLQNKSKRNKSCIKIIRKKEPKETIRTGDRV